LKAAMAAHMMRIDPITAGKLNGVMID